MPIPAFDTILNVLPPHLGDPRLRSDLSPYPCTTAELCTRFATSPARIAILDGFLRFRQKLFDVGITGFQWLDGSFLEDIEAQEGRDPLDIDVVTFIDSSIDLSQLAAILQIGNPDLLDRDLVKLTYKVDGFIVPMASNPRVIVDLTKYWYGLFSHRRDMVWKGMLQTELSDPSLDIVARSVLGGAP